MHDEEMHTAELSENVEGKEVKDFPVRPPFPILPKFIFAGAVKCGCTTMCDTLMKHPQVATVPNWGKIYDERTLFFHLHWNDDLPAKEQVITFIIYLPETF